MFGLAMESTPRLHGPLQQSRYLVIGESTAEEIVEVPCEAVLKQYTRLCSIRPTMARMDMHVWKYRVTDSKNMS